MVDRPRLPEADFTLIALDLLTFSSQAEQSVAAWEIIAARGEIASPGVEHTIRELVEAAARAREVRQFFLDMVPHEQVMRDFVAGLQALQQGEALAEATG